MILFRDISIFLQIVIFIKITNFLFETFDEVAEVNLKFQIERWQEYFWCWNIISTTNKITEIFFGVEILFPSRRFLVLKYYPHHQWNNIVIPTPGIFMGKLRSSVMGVNFLYYPIEFALTLSFQAFTKEFILSWEFSHKQGNICYLHRPIFNHKPN